MKDSTNKFDGLAQRKSYSFALELVRIALKVQRQEREYILTKQLIRSGTSIGANLQEASGRQSNKDLLTKLHIAYKEAKECRFWLYLLSDLSIIEEAASRNLLEKIDELLRIIGKSILTLRSRLNYPA